MENLKNKVIDKGYKIITENKRSISLVNESIKYCVILVDQYSEDGDERKDILNLQKELEIKYAFAEKGTILVINEIPDNREEIERNVYFFLRIYSDSLNSIPSKFDKELEIIFSPMIDINDNGDYTINPFELFDGLSINKYLAFINEAKSGDVVKYPRIYETHYLRYLTNKFFTVIYNK